MIHNFSFLLTLVLAHALLKPEVHGEQYIPQDVVDVKIIERLGGQIPMEAEFADESGKKVVLKDFLRKGKPLVVNLVYYKCPMLCNLVLNGLSDGLKQMKWEPGREFEILTVSVDPQEKPELASRKKEKYLGSLGKSGVEEGWHFLTGDEKNISKLAESLGFRYKILDNGEIAHGAALFMITPSGKISRYLYGVQYSGLDIKRGILDAMAEKEISVADKFLMLCYRYSSDAKGYVLFAGNFMKGTGIFILAAFSLFFFGFWIREIKKREKKKTELESSTVLTTRN